MRVLGRLSLFGLGLAGGFMAAAAVAKRALPSRGDAESDEVGLVAIFDGIDLDSRAQAFRGGSMLAWFGGIAVDLRDARLAPEAHLHVHAILGGIALKTAPDWRVESRVRGIGGGVHVASPEAEDPGAPRLVLDGFALFGGIAVGHDRDSQPRG